MPILEQDIKLLASQTLDDVPEGGGAATGNVIADGVSNNLFNDISELDRTYGRVNLRKVFPAVQTATVEGYFGAHVIIAKPPADPLVSATLFSTGETFDKRTAAQSRIESYLARGANYNGKLWSTHYTGSRLVMIYQREELPVPDIGDTLELIESEGQAGEKSQFVRIIRIDHNVQQFTASNGTTFKRRILQIEISDALRYDFHGPEISQYDDISAAGKVRSTVVADAARYYGCAALALAALTGDTSIKVGSIFAPLVPSTQAETAVLDVGATGEATVALATTPRAVTIPSANHTSRIRIKQGNRGFNYVFLLKPLPATGTVQVSYRAQRRWYTLTDNGAGGFDGLGSGAINYGTGSVAVTCAEMPDINTDVIISWGDPVSYSNRSAQGASVRKPEFAIPLEHQNIAPGSLSVSWTSASVVKTATDNGAGALQGDATGAICYAQGIVTIQPTAMPDAGAQFSIAYDRSDVVTELKTGIGVDGFGYCTLTTAQEPVPGTLTAKWWTILQLSETSGDQVSESKNSASGSEHMESRFSGAFLMSRI